MARRDRPGIQENEGSPLMVECGFMDSGFAGGGPRPGMTRFRVASRARSAGQRYLLSP